MKYHEAKQELTRCLNDNKTITIGKLKTLLTAMEIDPITVDSKRVRHLKEELRRRDKKLRNHKKTLRVLNT